MGIIDFNANLYLNVAFQKNGFYFKIELNEIDNIYHVHDRKQLLAKYNELDKKYIKLYLINYGDISITDIKIKKIKIGKTSIKYTNKQNIQPDSTQSTVVSKNGNIYLFAQIPNKYSDNEIYIYLILTLQNGKKKRVKYKYEFMN